MCLDVAPHLPFRGDRGPGREEACPCLYGSGGPNLHLSRVCPTLESREHRGRRPVKCLGQKGGRQEVLAAAKGVKKMVQRGGVIWRQVRRVVGLWVGGWGNTFSSS